MSEQAEPTSRVELVFRRVGQEVWIEFYEPGLRLRFEQTREEIGQVRDICGKLLEDWDATTREIEKKYGKG